MDSFRVILLIVGLLVVVGIIIFDRLRKEKLKAGYHHYDDPLLNDDNDPLFAKRADPIDEEDLLALKQEYDIHADDDEMESGFEEEPVVAESDVETQNDNDDVTEDAPAMEKPFDNEPEIIMLAIITKKESSISGKILRELMEQNDFSYGEMGIFHRLYQGSPVVSIANLQEPGTFDLDNLDDLNSRGIWIFIQLPCTIDGVEAVDELINVARKVADSINATIYNRQKQPLDDALITSIKQIAANYKAQISK
jgi:cell division protein ZipA